MKPLVNEATLDELLFEPITRLIMQRDGITEGDLRRLMADVARRRRQGSSEAPMSESGDSEHGQGIQGDDEAQGEEFDLGGGGGPGNDGLRERRLVPPAAAHPCQRPRSVADRS